MEELGGQGSQYKVGGWKVAGWLGGCNKMIVSDVKIGKSAGQLVNFVCTEYLDNVMWNLLERIIFREIYCLSYVMKQWMITRSDLSNFYYICWVKRYKSTPQQF